MGTFSLMRFTVQMFYFDQCKSGWGGYVEESFHSFLNFICSLLYIFQFHPGTSFYPCVLGPYSYSRKEHCEPSIFPTEIRKCGTFIINTS